MRMNNKERLCQRVAAALRHQGLMLSTAESCTGGGVAHALTALPGSSAWFDSGFITYSNAAKQAMLGVTEATLVAHGAVSTATAAEMAQGAIAHGRAQIACSSTGIAGPGGGTVDKPVGTVCFGWALAGQELVTARHRLFGDRERVREQAIAIALQGILDMLK
jgi:nicotinamide-nucleotide amidase